MVENGKLPNTWFIDIDGVIFLHNGYLDKKAGELESPLPGVSEFFNNLDSNDKIILCTARKESFRKITEDSLVAAGIHYDILIMGLTTGKRILINDKKDEGMKTAFAINVTRNKGLQTLIKRSVN